jgi:hypothetical protein
MIPIKLVACIEVSYEEELILSSGQFPERLEGYESHDQMAGPTRDLLESNGLLWTDPFVSLFILSPDETTDHLCGAFGYPFEVNITEVIHDVVIACSDDIQNSLKKTKTRVLADLRDKTETEKLSILLSAREQSEQGRAEARMNRRLRLTDLRLPTEKLSARTKPKGDVGAEKVMVGNAVSSWKQWVGQIDKTIGAFGDEELQREVAPGRNRVYYLLGHLTAVHDRMFTTLRVGERLHPELDEEFIVKADKTDLDDELPAAELRKAWREVNDKLTAAIEKLSAEEWLERHDSVSAEDFKKEPHRNRLAVLLSRTTHAAMHEGQMRLAGKK